MARVPGGPTPSQLLTTQAGTGTGTRLARDHNLKLALDYALPHAQTLSLNAQPQWQNN